MSVKNTVMGMAAGITAGVVIGTTVGIVVKSMTKPKSAVRKKMSSAFETVGDMFSNLAKFTN